MRVFNEYSAFFLERYVNAVNKKMVKYEFNNKTKLIKWCLEVNRAQFL